ncbi:unnamed protein product [Leuciscus chuanchicus]
MLSAWELTEENLMAITTDNGANVVKAAQLNRWTWQQCFGHRLHLAIENAMKYQCVVRAVRVCKNIVSAFSYSWKKKAALGKADLDVLETVNRALSPLMELTDCLSGEEYVTISFVRPVLHILNSRVLAEEEDDVELTKTIKTSILAYLKEKYSDPITEELLDTNSFVDPRFKTTYISVHHVCAPPFRKSENRDGVSSCSPHGKYH